MDSAARDLFLPHNSDYREFPLPVSLQWDHKYYHTIVVLAMCE